MAPEAPAAQRRQTSPVAPCNSPPRQRNSLGGYTAGYTQGTHRAHTGYTQGTHRVHTGYTQGTRRVHTALCCCYGAPGCILKQTAHLGTHRVHTGYTQGTHRVSSGLSPVRSPTNSRRLACQSSARTMLVYIETKLAAQGGAPKFRKNLS